MHNSFKLVLSLGPFTLLFYKHSFVSFGKENHVKLMSDGEHSSIFMMIKIWMQLLEKSFREMI
jgi:hypothetical protein